jgi:hypothetical protein
MNITNPYESPIERANGSVTRFRWVPIAMGILLSITILIARYRIVPVYQEFDSELSPATLLAISPWTPVAVLVCSIIFAFYSTKSTTHWHDVALIMTGFLAIVALVAFCVFAFMIPFIPIVTRMH